MKPHLRVVCAIILKQNKTLAVQRSEKMILPLKWEVACIKREIQEELNIAIEVGQRLTPATHEYPDFTIELIPYVSTYKSGILTLNEHSQKLWLEKSKLITLDWASADVPIVMEYVDLHPVSYFDTIDN